MTDMVKLADETIEIEVDGSTNDQLYFFPLGRPVRGRFDYNRVAEPKAKMLTNQWPTPIPGQRLAVNPATGEAQLIEGLRDPEHQMIREAAERRGRIPQNETFRDVDTATWLFHMRNAVECGLARIVRGAFPDKIEGTPKTSLFPRQKGSNEQLADAIKEQTAVMREMMMMLAQQNQRK